MALSEHIIILLYHHIAEPPPNAGVRGLYVTKGQFRKQLAWMLKNGFTFTTFHQLAAGRAESPNPTVILTFDDGHLDNYTHGFPVFKEFQVPAIIFPVVGDIGKRNLSWEDANKCPVNLMTVEQIQEMAKWGVEFGSHLMRHVRLGHIEQSTGRRELSESKKRLELITGQTVRTIAYPFGDVNPKIHQAAQKAGYQFGVTCEPGIATPEKPPLLLPRNVVKGSKWYHPIKFKRMMQTFKQQVERS